LTQKFLRNVAASVRQRLLNIAHERNEAFQLVLGRFAVERLLFRLSRSSYRKQFVVKGATLFRLWSERMHRPTRDLDLLGLDEEDSRRVKEIFQELCRLDVPEDGLRLPVGAVSVNPLRVGTDFEGLRVLLRATLAGARIPMQVDIGFGDPVSPPAEEVEFPTLLRLPAPRLLAYRRETVVAEKFDAMVKLGMANSRMKDFFDIWFLAKRFLFHGASLRGAIRATSTRRGAFSAETAIALTPEFSTDPAKTAQWKVFLRRSGLEEVAPTLDAPVLS
jgi:predicted nucleotidyltransferase component of viral defense system